MANSLYLDLELLESDLRNVISQGIKSANARDLFGEIHLIPIDSDLNSKTLFPAVYMYAYKNGVYSPTQEDIEIEPYSRFTVVVETYTNGTNRRSQNMRLAQFVTYLLQENKQLDNYYNRGLKLDQDQELSSFVDGVNRRSLRFSGVINNASKLIYNKEM